VLNLPRKFWILLFVWILIQVTSLVLGGITLGNDSSRYIESGTGFFEGGELNSRAAPYLTYIFLVGLSDWMGAGLTGVVMFQLIAAVAALWFVFDLGRSVGGEWAGFWAALPVATFLDFTQWHRYVLTDSLSASLTVFSIWLLYQCLTKRGWWIYPVLLPTLAAGALLRPNGWLVVLLAIIVMAFVVSSNWAARCLAGVGGVIALLLVIPLTPSFSVSLDAESPASQVIEGRVIWGAEQTYKDMPAVELSAPGYSGVFEYAIAQPVAYISLMASRVGWELVGVRPYFSTKHNAYVLLYLIPVYLFALIGSTRSWRHPAILLSVATFALHMGLVAITFADWSGRFLTYAFPLLCVCFGAGVSLLGKIKTGIWPTAKGPHRNWLRFARKRSRLRAGLSEAEALEIAENEVREARQARRTP